MKYTFLIKEEAGKMQFVIDGHLSAAETTTQTHAIKHHDIAFILDNLIPVKRSHMIALNYEYEGIPADLRRLAGFNWQKNFARFTLSEKSVDFQTGEINVENQWNFEVKEDHKDQEYPIDCKIKIIQTVANGNVAHVVRRDEEWQNA